jgi:TatD DNase family protein
VIYFDAHNHVCDPRLNPFRDQVLADLSHIDLRGSVVNSSSEREWGDISDLALRFPWVIPAFGIHPWYVEQAGEGWRERLVHRLDAHPNATLGEIGLDRWIANCDIALQQEIFVCQLSLAAERNLPVSIHCLKAWGLLLEILRQTPLPACGFLLHSYSGPEEMVRDFAGLGGRFSFSPYFLHERKAAQREVFRRIPEECLLVETDAPDMWPPEERNQHPLREDLGTKALNHPANIEVAYAGLAEVRGIPLKTLAAVVATNFNRLFDTRVR